MIGAEAGEVMAVVQDLPCPTETVCTNRMGAAATPSGAPQFRADHRAHARAIGKKRDGCRQI
jgi:hypothetical protein